MNKNLKQKRLDTLFIGLALFATYFGAGNLIFPPYVGLQSGSRWILGMAGLIFSGVLLPVSAMAVIGKCGSVPNITNHIHRGFYTGFMGASMFIILFVANPRTAATAIEMGLQGIFPNIPYIPCVIVYFLIVFLMAKDKGKALDRVGKILTPVMVAILLVLIIIGIVSPIGTPADTGIEAPFVNAFLTGYQTGDVLVSFGLASVFLATIQSKGFAEDERRTVLGIAAVIAFICLAVVYGGLFYMGACGSSTYPADIGRAVLLVDIIHQVGGRAAMIGLGGAAILACLTTAIAQATAVSDYIEMVTHNRFNYVWTIAGACFISTAIALIGVDRIVVLANPIYAAAYPVALAMFLLGVFQKYIPNDGAYKGSILLVLVYSVSEALVGTGLPVGFLEICVTKMPLASVGFGWLIPFLVGFVMGALVYVVHYKSASVRDLNT